MFGLVINLKKLCLKKRKGIGLVESLLLIVVVAFTVGAILQTSYLTSKMQIEGRRYIATHKSMVSFFHTLESINPADIMTIGDIRDEVMSIDHVKNEKYPNIIRVDATSNDRLVTVNIVYDDTGRYDATGRNEKIITNHYNSFSNKTVPDYKDKS